MKFPTIYKRTSSGAVQIWQQEINPNDSGQYRTISGQIDGKQVVSEWTSCIVTNAGRSNERSTAEQAQSEIEANYKKKLARDYHESLSEIDQEIIFKPMLAEKYSDYISRFNFKKAIVEPKYDGFRSVARFQDGQVNLWTRNGKRINTCPHICADLFPILSANPEWVIDGELYNHEFKDDFNELSSIIKRPKPSKEDLEKSERLMQYYVYDIAALDNCFDRYQILKQVLSGLKYVVVTPAYEVTSPAEVDMYYEQFLQEGYEGLMLRENKPYVGKRTSALLKRKETIDQEFILADIIEGTGNWAGKGKKAKLYLPNSNETFGAGIKGTQDFCKDLLANKEKYIGKKATVTYQALTPDGVPRFGIVKEFDRQDV